jgi:hypothetical protein
VPALSVLPTAHGLAVHAPGGGRILPWEVAQALLDDPGLVVQTAAIGDLSSWDIDRLLCAIAHGDPAVPALFDRGEVERQRIQELRRQPRTWKATIDAGVIVGDLEAACCRAGLALPDGQPLMAVAAISLLMERAQGQLSVRERLRADHPWIGDAAWLSASGHLAEMVVLEGARRDDIRRAVVPGALPVLQLLAHPERFSAARTEVRAAMQAILTGTVRWNERGHLALESEVGTQFAVAGAYLGLGVGGLHSADPPGVVAGPLWDLDVASYYPSLIASDSISPPQLPDFPARVRRLMERRLAAKRMGDQVASNALKVVINSLYGQLGNHRSSLFSPADALRVVLTGQLRLLQLIEGCLDAGCRLVSANTDGVVVAGDPALAAQAWEAATGLTLERSGYQRLWRTSVNDYIATGPDGRVAKARGRFAGGEEEGEGARRSTAPIIARAAVERLVSGTPIAESICASTAITDFACWRHARDLLWGGVPVAGSVVRWVIGRGGTPLVQFTGGRPAATIAQRAVRVVDPARIDVGIIDRSWYAAEAQDLVDKVLGTDQGAKQLSVFDPPDGQSADQQARPGEATGR